LYLRLEDETWHGYPSQNMEDILLIDDDVELCQMLTEYLGRYDLHIHAVHRGDTGLEAARSRPWPMILLDVMLPGIDGFEVLKRIRTFSSDSVLLLTARGEDVDRIVGLEMGADDYLAKPFNTRELLARIRAVRRRGAVPSIACESSALVVEDLVLDPAARTVRQDGTLIDLTDVEFTLLDVLMRAPGKVIERLPKPSSAENSIPLIAASTCTLAACAVNSPATATATIASRPFAVLATNWPFAEH